MDRLRNKVAIIRGGAQGTGRATALRLGSEGAKVVIGDLQKDDSTSKEIIAAGGEAIHVVMDTRDLADWSNLVRVGGGPKRSGRRGRCLDTRRRATIGNASVTLLQHPALPPQLWSLVKLAVPDGNSQHGRTVR